MRTQLWWAIAALAAISVSGCNCSKPVTTCDAGFSLVNGTCKPLMMTCGEGAGTVGAMCADQHRLCATAGGAHCTTCVSGYMDFAGSCEVPTTCAQLACDTTHQECSDTPNGHCTGCSSGFTRDGGEGPCHTPVTCAELHCASGESCIEPSGVGDAYCADGCGTNAIGDDAGVCHGCPSCTDSAAGEDGPYLGGLTGEARCICQTLPGYFWEEGQFPGVKACDADHDGWVRESAKLALESPNDAVSTNARCSLRAINTITLENERGELKVVPLAVASLYETDRNDDQVALTQAQSLGKLPDSYGDGGRALTAAELNSFTKYCADTQADFNENGLADTSEWQANPDLTAVKAAFKPFAPFVYFGELDEGWFEPGVNGAPGTWRVKERSRLTTASSGDAVGFAGPADAGDFWRQCDRMTDSTWQTAVLTGSPQQNFDFARFGPDDGGWSGMNHSSQFKCVIAVTQVQSGDPANFFTISQLLNQGLQPDSCVTAGQPQPPPVGVPVDNPSTAGFSCGLLDYSALSNGQAVWATAGYLAYTVPGGYVRGCISECVEHADRCPGFDPSQSINPSSCSTENGEYGKLVCTCDPRFSGPDCSESCPGDPTRPTLAISNLFVGPEHIGLDGGLVANADGYWLCGKPSSTAYADAGQPFLGDVPLDPDGGYSLRAEIPVVRSSVDPLIDTSADGGGYAIR